MPLKLTREIPYTVTVDGEPIRLFLTRMLIEEFVPFEAEFLAYARGRKTTPNPAEAVSVDEFKQKVAERATGGLDYVGWLRSVFQRYVRVQAGDLEIDGRAVTRGEQFVDVLGRYGEVVSTVLFELWSRNKLSDEQKKTLASRPASATTSSPAPLTADSGTAPATTATSAAPSSSATNADATAPSSDASSGTTDPLPSAPALSAV